MCHGIPIRITSRTYYERTGRLLHLPVHLFLRRWHRCHVLCLLFRTLPHTHSFTRHGILDDWYLFEYSRFPRGRAYSIGKDQMVVLRDVHWIDNHRYCSGVAVVSRGKAIGTYQTLG